MTSSAGLQIVSTRATYPITGSTAAELRGAIRLLGPTREGRTFGAFTDWRIDWSFGSRTSGNGVWLSSLRVELDVHVILPRWRPPRSADETLSTSWERYLAAVEMHEQGHVALAEEAAREVLRALEALGSFPNAAGIEAAATKAAGLVVEAARHRERAYDVSTEHGVIQGVRL